MNVEIKFTTLAYISQRKLQSFSDHFILYREYSGECKLLLHSFRQERSTRLYISNGLNTFDVP